MAEILSILGLLIAVGGIVTGVSYKFYRDSKKDNSIYGFDKGKAEATDDFIIIELKHVQKQIQDMRDDIEHGHMDYDSMQKQIADIRERLARWEGPQ